MNLRRFIDHLVCAHDYRRNRTSALAARGYYELSISASTNEEFDAQLPYEMIIVGVK